MGAEQWFWFKYRMDGELAIGRQEEFPIDEEAELMGMSCRLWSWQEDQHRMVQLCLGKSAGVCWRNV